MSYTVTVIRIQLKKLVQKIAVKEKKIEELLATYPRSLDELREFCRWPEIEEELLALLTKQYFLRKGIHAIL